MDGWEERRSLVCSSYALLKLERNLSASLKTDTISSQLDNLSGQTKSQRNEAHG